MLAPLPRLQTIVTPSSSRAVLLWSQADARFRALLELALPNMEQANSLVDVRDAVSALAQLLASALQQPERGCVLDGRSALLRQLKALREYRPLLDALGFEPLNGADDERAFRLVLLDGGPRGPALVSALGGILAREAARLDSAVVRAAQEGRIPFVW